MKLGRNTASDTALAEVFRIFYTSVYGVSYTFSEYLEEMLSLENK